jgi:hypothetical protein
MLYVMLHSPYCSLLPHKQFAVTDSAPAEKRSSVQPIRLIDTKRYVSMAEHFCYSDDELLCHRLQNLPSVDFIFKSNLLIDDQYLTTHWEVMYMYREVKK